MKHMAELGRRGARARWRLTPEQRLLAKTNKNGPVVRPELGPCWVFGGAIHIRTGYGRFHLGKSEWAHRAAWRLWRGEIPEDLFVCHSCDNRRCVNPTHLFLGTALDNAQDRDSKGRLAPAARSLSDAEADEIRRRVAGGAPLRQVAKAFGISTTGVYKLVHRRTYKNVG